jgi:RNA polymerase sigma-70 factor (ECF subfamily)
MLASASVGEAMARSAADEGASALFAAEYPRLAGWCARLVADPDRAHEIASEAFVRLWSRWSGVDEPRGFLYVTATNLVRDHWRKVERERRANRHAAGRSMESERKDEPAERRDPELWVLVGALPEPQRAPVLLHYVAGFSVREVAGLLGRNENTVKSDLLRARAKLRQELEAGNG